MKIPSEHTICGKRYPAEYSVFMLHPLRRQTLVMSILMDFHPDDKDNDHFQLAIDQWQAVFDITASKCSRNTTSGVQEAPEDTEWMGESSVYYSPEKIKDSRLAYESFNHDHREDRSGSTEKRSNGEQSLTDTSAFGTGGWDPFHPSLKTVSYFCRLARYIFS